GATRGEGAPATAAIDPGSIRLKRVYDGAEPGDGFRVLVDRLWPRGITREEAAIDDWAKDLAPSPQLRAWFAHLPERFEKFRLTYIEELCRHQQRIAELRRRAGQGAVTLLFAARNR